MTPKLEFALRDRLGRSWQCGTVQLDSVLPHRLNASYVGSDGQRATPMMIHHAVFGSISRFMAMLLDHHAGALPFWLLAKASSLRDRKFIKQFKVDPTACGLAEIFA